MKCKKIILVFIFLLYSCSNNSNDMIDMDTKKDISSLDKSIEQINQSIMLGMRDDRYTRWILDDIDMSFVDGDESEISKKQYEFLDLVKSGEMSNSINSKNTGTILVNNSPINNTPPLGSSSSNSSLNMFGVYRSNYSVDGNDSGEGADMIFGEYRDILIVK